MKKRLKIYFLQETQFNENEGKINTKLNKDTKHFSIHFKQYEVLHLNKTNCEF